MMNLTATNKMNEYIRIISEVMKGNILGLSETLYEKDKYTFEHCQRVLDYCFLIGYELGLSKEKIETLAVAAFFHDIGKIAISNKILEKPGTLTDEEREIIQTHPQISAGVLRVAGGDREAVKTLACHHERYDGRGYPYGLQGDRIPLLSRIISVADSYDAMTTNRSYSLALGKDEALRRLIAGSGTQFDPEIVDVFLDRIEYPQVYLLEAV